VLAALLAALAGCAHAPPPLPPPPPPPQPLDVEIRVIVAPDVNPNRSGRASPDSPEICRISRIITSTALSWRLFRT